MHCNAYGKGEPVLLIHGLPTNGRLWDQVVRDLSSRFRCFVVDLPGMGATPSLPYGPSYFEQVAAQIEEVRVRHHVQRWHIVGHDGGCAIAVHYAHLFAERVGCMALLSPAILPDLRPFFLMELLRWPVVGEILAPVVHTLFWHVALPRAIPSRHNQPQRASFFENFSDIQGPWRLMRLVRWGKPEVMLRNVPSILRKLTCPALVIHGSRDVLPASFAERTADLIENAQLITLDSGHFVPLEKADQLARGLMAHFRSHDVPADKQRSPHQVVDQANRSAKRTRRHSRLFPAAAAR